MNKGRNLSMFFTALYRNFRINIVRAAYEASSANDWIFAPGNREPRENLIGLAGSRISWRKLTHISSPSCKYTSPNVMLCMCCCFILLHAEIVITEVPVSYLLNMKEGREIERKENVWAVKGNTIWDGQKHFPLLMFPGNVHSFLWWRCLRESVNCKEVKLYYEELWTRDLLFTIEISIPMLEWRN